MNTLKYNFYNMIGFKTLLRKYFRFLVDDYHFIETTKENLIIPEWLIKGIAYTNNSKVIIFTDDIRENRFVTIIYKIQSDYKIPIYTEDYFTLEDFLRKLDIEFDPSQITEYSNNSGLKSNIEKTAYYLKKYSKELLF